MTVRRPWSYPRAIAGLALAGLLAVLASQPYASAGTRPVVTAPRLTVAAHAFVRVIVQGSTPGTRAAERAVARSGGRVTRKLPIVDGVAATVPAAAVPALSVAPGVAAVTPDRRTHVQAVPADQGNLQPVKSVYPQVVRADDVWAAGRTGAGVTIALVDTGVTEVADLAGRVVPVVNDRTGQTHECENLSEERDCADSYGHGTFIAGTIAGNGADSGGRWKGAAPGARILSVKIAGADGTADVSNVLAAVQWVVSFRDTYNIRVLNLSLGTDSTQTYARDPLNYAVERAWAAGVAVIVAASNRGPDPRTVSKPGDDPFVVTVGAIDDRGTKGLGDDVLPDFTSRGPTAADGIAKPDVVAPGAHIVSLRAPGSTIDSLFTNYIDGAYRAGSGTSMATGVVSGIAALLLQANPGWSPDRLKYALLHTTRPTASADPMAVGSGLVDAYQAAFAAPAGTANQGLARSNGRGTLYQSRGSVRMTVDDPDSGNVGILLGPLLTAQLLLWDPLGWTTSNWDRNTWYSTGWATSRWVPLDWYGSDWPGTNWRNDYIWYGSAWSGGAWYGAWE
jgi:serine protease AprX